jgi:outer membrane protein
MVMKKVFNFTVLLAAFIVLGQMPARAEGKQAFVDVAKVFDGYAKTKENDKTLQQAGKKKEEERDAIVHEIRQAKDEMALLSDEAKAKKQDSLAAKMKELEAFDGQTRQALGEQRNKVVRDIFKDIDNAIQKYGQAKQLDVIFNERALLYRNEKMDITKEITDTLNKEYSTKKK